MILFSDRGCPFAHRVLALLEHLGHTVDRRESTVGHKPEGLRQYSSSERIPLLVHGDLVLTESRVMLEHLAEHLDFAEAYPSDIATRTLHRHAMAVADDFLAPLLLGRALTPADELRLADVLDALEEATATVEPHPCLLTMHVAPLWLRFRLWQPNGKVTRAVEARTALCEWLDEAVELDCLGRTAPDPVTHREDLERAREAGLLQPA